MWQVDDLIHYGILFSFYAVIALAAMFGRKSRNYFRLNFISKGVLFLLLALSSYAGVFYLLYKLCHGYNFWFYFSAVFIYAGLITHLFLPLERLNRSGKTDEG